MKQEHVIGIIIGCLFASTVYIAFEYVRVTNNLVYTQERLDIYYEIAMEQWAKEQLTDFLNTDITNINMVTPFIYDIVLLNGTSLILQKYDGSWHTT